MPGAVAVSVADNCEFNGPCLYVGGDYAPLPLYGAFYLNFNGASYSNGNVGARYLVMYIFLIWHGFSTPLGENILVQARFSRVLRKTVRETRRNLQMKRAKMLFPVLISDENLLAAIEEVNRTHRWSLHHRPNKTVALYYIFRRVHL